MECNLCFPSNYASRMTREVDRIMLSWGNDVWSNRAPQATCYMMRRPICGWNF